MLRVWPCRIQHELVGREQQRRRDGVQCRVREQHRQGVDGRCRAGAELDRCWAGEEWLEDEAEDVDGEVEEVEVGVAACHDASHRVIIATEPVMLNGGDDRPNESWPGNYVAPCGGMRDECVLLGKTPGRYLTSH